MNAVTAKPRHFSLHVFRIEEGLGNACVLQLPDGRFGVVDWGTQRPEAIGSAFEIISDATIAFVAATHAHSDHTLGIERLLREAVRRGIQVERFAYPAASLHKKFACLTRARIAARELRISMSEVNIDEFETAEGPQRPPALAVGEGWEVRVLSPAATAVGKSEVRALQKEVVPGNDTSMVILFRFHGGLSVGRGVLTGDAERSTLEFARRTAERFPHLDLRNDCLVLPHHGARDGVPDWLLERSTGAIVISAPTASEHHPSRNTLMAAAHRCAMSGAKMYCTSYAQACQEAYRAHVAMSEQRLVKPGRCFGDFTIDIDDLQGARFSRSSDAGEARRAYGLCRVTTPLPAAGAEGSRQP